MIDPLLSLSFNLHAQRGTYALLIGSGISRSADIPTGWEVTLDLIGKLAHLQREACEGNEAPWYAEKYGKDPDYSEILSAVAPTSAAQQQLLKAYFEPTEEEREEGKKLPTAAHKAIAQLVGSGHIRVIVTTNFDRLLEAALEAEGIPPVVIASPDAARGAPPLAHSKCTIIKVHGDYLDHRIKNSPEALSKYDKAVDRLLDQVFDE
jgi:NAD-dependent SIR2 family protein deacetylase